MYFEIYFGMIYTIGKIWVKSRIILDFNAGRGLCVTRCARLAGSHKSIWPDVLTLSRFDVIYFFFLPLGAQNS